MTCNAEQQLRAAGSSLDDGVMSLCGSEDHSTGAFIAAVSAVTCTVQGV